MNLKTAFATFCGVILLGVLVLLGADWYTARTFDQVMRDKIEQLNKGDYIRASWYSSSTWPFSRNGVLHITVLSKTMQENLRLGHATLDMQSLADSQEQLKEQIARNDDKPADFFLNVTNTVYPLMIKGSLTPDMKRGTLAEWVKAQALPNQLPIVASWQYAAYNQSLDAKLVMDDWFLKRDSVEFKMNAADLSLSGTPDQMVLQYGWNGLVSENKDQQQTQLIIKPLEGHAVLEKLAGIWVQTKGDFKLSGLNFSAGGARGELGQFTWSGKMYDQMTETGKTLDTKEDLALASLTLDTPQSHLNVQDARLALVLSGVNKDGLESVLNELQKSKPDFAKVMKAANKVSTKSIRLTVAPLQMVLNDAPITVNGYVMTTPVEVEQLMLHGNGDFSYLLRGDGQISVAPALLKTAPASLQPLLAQWVEQGYLKTIEKEGLVAHVVLANSQLSVNDQVVTMAEE